LRHNLKVEERWRRWSYGSRALYTCVYD